MRTLNSDFKIYFIFFNQFGSLETSEDLEIYEIQRLTFIPGDTGARFHYLYRECENQLIIYVDNEAFLQVRCSKELFFP